VSFFDPTPRDARESGFAAFPSDGPPDNVLGGAVAFALVLARTEDVAVLVHGGAAYPTGFHFSLAVRRRAGDEVFNPLGNSILGGGPPSSPPDESLRFGLEFADGSMVTDRDEFPEEVAEGRPVLLPTGGTGSSLHYETYVWLSPLPPPGPMAFVCQWQAHGIALTRVELDADIVRRAAEQAIELWPIGPPSEGGYTSTVLRADKPESEK